MPTITSSGIAYDDRGAGEPTLLFLPGWCGPRTVFAPLVSELEGRCRTLAVDWRGHGDSTPADGDFGFAELVDDAISVMTHSSADSVIPVTAAHAGWAAIELYRRLGPTRVPKLVFLDWMVLGAPTPFREALDAMRTPTSTRQVVDQITKMWTAGLDIPALTAYVASMARMGDEMWIRAARAIAHQFDAAGSPLAALAALDTRPRTLHLYAQPADPAYLDAQREMAELHTWFEVERLDAQSHFPVFEDPDYIASRVLEFIHPPIPGTT